MTRFDFRLFQSTDVRRMVRREVHEALRYHEGEDRFKMRRLLSGAFADPSIFYDDVNAQKAFLQLVGYDRAFQLMREYRLFGPAQHVTSFDSPHLTDPGGMWRSFRDVVSSSSDQGGMEVSTKKLLRIITKLRESIFTAREIGLPFNVLRSVRVNFLRGDLEIITPRDDDRLTFTSVSLPQVHMPRGEGMRDPGAVLSPDIGLRVLGEGQLAIVANELLRALTRIGGDERIVDGWPYERSVEALIQTFRDVDATPFVEMVIDQLIDEGLILEGSRHLIVATYHDYMLSHLERQLQRMAGIEPDLDAEGTVSALMHSLYLALDTEAIPDEIRGDGAAEDIYRSARSKLKGFVQEQARNDETRSVIKYYLDRHGQRGLSWFLGQTLPLGALYGDPDQFHLNGMKLAVAFNPDDHHGWFEYSAVADWVRSIVDPYWDGPNGGEDTLFISADTPVPANNNNVSVAPDKPGTSNLSTILIYGALSVGGGGTKIV